MESSYNHTVVGNRSATHPNTRVGAGHALPLRDVWVPWITRAIFVAGFLLAFTAPIFGQTPIDPLTIDGNGNVGIGTATPSVKFEVKGVALFSGTQAAPIKDFLYIGSDGRVGIGTTTPQKQFEIRKDQAAGLGAILLLQNYGGGAGAGVAIDFNGHDTKSNDPTARIQSIDDGSFSSHLVFLAKQPGNFTNGLVERLRIASDGNVGIGTGPVKITAKLEVKGRIKDQTGFVTPVGTIVAYGGSSAPDGWILCDGRTIKEGIYTDLKNVLGKDTLPDLRSRFVVGAGQGTGNGLTKYDRNAKGGAENVTLTWAQMPAHTHGYHKAKHNYGHANGGTDWSRYGHENQANEDQTERAGNGEAHENRPPYYALTYIIKF